MFIKNVVDSYMFISNLLVVIKVDFCNSILFNYKFKEDHIQQVGDKFLICSIERLLCLKKKKCMYFCVYV